MSASEDTSPKQDVDARVTPQIVNARAGAGSRREASTTVGLSDQPIECEQGAGSMIVAELQKVNRADEGPPVLLDDDVRRFVRASKAASTLRGYGCDWKDFCRWCDGRGLCPLPATAETIAAYIAECAARLKVGSIQRRLNAIAEAHKVAGLDSPTHQPIVAATIKGIRRTKGVAPTQKAPALTADVRAMVNVTDAGLIGLRDRALVLLGFAGAFRRSELVGLSVDDCGFSNDGLTVSLRHSKTDQEGAGRKVGIPYGSNPQTCPVRSVHAWLEAAAIAEGPVFRSIDRHGHLKPAALRGLDVARIIKKLADRAGLDARKFAGHSLRAGHATTAAIGGASERSIMNQTGHRSVQMVRRYIRDGSLFRENSGGKLGL
jgi:site-specific recombinase XerD